MKHRVTFFLTICLVAAASFVFAQTATPTATVPDNYTDADAGEATNPYEIATWQNLYWLSQNSDYWDAHFIQTADINFGTASPTIQEWDDGKGWTPIGSFCPLSGDPAFKGVYDGGNNSIIGLFADRAAVDDGGFQPPGEGHPEDPVICPITSVGLFGFVDEAVIRDLNLIDVNMSGLIGVGALAVQTISSTIENVSASGTVSGAEGVGGLIAIADNSSISNVSSSVNVFTANFSGGLLGAALESTIFGSFATGSITAEEFIFPGGLGPQGGMLATFGMADRRYSRSSGSSTSDYRSSGFAIGGFIGDAVACIIEQSYSTGDVQGGDETGGFASYIANNTIIRESFSTSSVNGVDDVGGFIGSAVSGEIHDSYHRGNVEGEDNVGGFMGGGGFSTVTITLSYSAGSVNGSTDVNGFVGFFDDSEGGVLSIENSYWDVDTDGIPGTNSGDDNEGAIGKSTLEMQSILTFPAEDGWSMQEDPDIPRNYPLLTWQLDSNAKQRGTWTLGTGDPPAIPLSGWSTWVTLLLMSIVAVRIALRKLL